MRRYFNRAIKYLCFSVIFCFVCVMFISFNNGYSHFVKATNEVITNKGFAKQELNEKGKKLYEFLSSEIADIAKGEESLTSITINSETLESWGVKKVYTKAEVGEVNFNNSKINELFFNQFDFSLVISALLHDLPYELYWFDKTSTGGYSGGVTIQEGITEKEVVSCIVTFKVADEYKAVVYDEQNPTVDTSKTLLASNVLVNAQNIVETYRELKDYQKLLAYKNKICDLVEYSHEAADENYTGDYGNPWQVIYVFDNNPETNVVCEGYAKAFQLLCNLSTFEDEHVKCYTVSGVMSGGTGAGNHMWNVVVMDDGFSYIVDITNSDEGSIGQDGELFIREYDSYVADKSYAFSIGSETITFKYNLTTENLWGTTEESILHLASEEYQIDHPTIKVDSQELVYNNTALTAGLNGSGEFDILFYFDNHAGEENLYNWTYEWHETYHGHQGSLMNESPKKAGTYWLQVIATSKTNNDYSVIHYQEITINPKTLTVKNVRGENREFDGSKNINLLNIELSGVVDGDQVSLDKESINASINNSNVGTYNKVNLTNLTLSGADKNNYRISSTLENVSMITLTISSTTPRVTENFTKIKRAGKKIIDVNIVFIAKGVTNQEIDGIVVWIDEEGNNLDINTKITKGTEYKYKFTPNDSNYSEYIGSVMLWGEEEEKEFINKRDIPKIIEYSMYVITFIIILAFSIVAMKRLVHKKKANK